MGVNLGCRSDEQSISHTDSYEHNNAIFFDHDNKELTFGPNPHNASTPERQKRTQDDQVFNEITSVLTPYAANVTCQELKLARAKSYSASPMFYHVGALVTERLLTIHLCLPSYIRPRKDVLQLDELLSPKTRNSVISF